MAGNRGAGKTELTKPHRQLERTGGTALQDRTIDAGAEIVANNLRRQRCVEERDLQSGWDLDQTIAGSLAPPDLMMDLNCPVGTLKRRIALRVRQMQEIPTAYFSRPNSIDEGWLMDDKMSPVLVLPTDKLNDVTHRVDRADLFRQIEKHL